MMNAPVDDLREWVLILFGLVSCFGSLLTQFLPSSGMYISSPDLLYRGKV